MKVTEENKEDLLKEYVRDLSMSTQAAIPRKLAKYSAKPNIKTIKELPHRVLVSEYALTLEFIILMRKQCSILMKILYNESFKPTSLEKFSKNFEKLSQKCEKIKRQEHLEEREKRKKLREYRQRASKGRKELVELRDKLINQGYQPPTDRYIKEVKGGRFEVEPSTDVSGSYYKYIDKEYSVFFNLVNQVYVFHNKDSDISTTYIRATNKILGKKKKKDIFVECPKEIKKIFDKYIKKIDKEFEDIVPPNEELWYRDDDSDV